MRILDCGLVEYREALALQERLAAEIAAGNEEETLLLLEHPAVYTIGRGGDLANILDSTLPVERINRGGDVAWHGPGQLVGYPLVHLGRRGRDLHRWMRFLEEVLIATLVAFHIPAHRVAGQTGVWSSRGKIGFIGVGVRHWVTLHGFALNVCPDLRSYERINPCGLAGCAVSSMMMETQTPPSMAEVKHTAPVLFLQQVTKHLPRTPPPPSLVPR
ncbi:lipoate-protein ligase B [Desulfobulbus propionicus DSM 2032]|uniref:Octanoyltransferase n=1 Tax=Desulfobulbus propionicus (strain ATCC 33891 / DSM 2032 / VKM B-1956 / 1pr3) TaxID=577650 RepID=A0A7U4DP05_DESPD|nr:lipoyl(octanoyl) transferase LipB [Desulfobulbus propionicus]ADW17651.1 lipoate-protein ligase B [Desulfobulbus propionicus DSM 2032]